MQDEILDFVRALKSTSHSIFFYESSKEKHEILFAFLQDGIEKGKGAIYVTGQETPTQIRKNMEDFGINVKGLEKEGTLKLVNYDQIYIIDGKVDISKIFAFWEKLFDEAIERGLNEFNVCGEMACFFKHRNERDLVEYELRIGRKLDMAVTGICAYDINHIKLLDANLFLNLIKAHGFTITPSFANEVNFESFYPSIVEEELQTVLGPTAVQAVLWHLERKYSITKEKIGENPEAFMASLEGFFGSGGAELLKKEILEELYSKIGLRPLYI